MGAAKSMRMRINGTMKTNSTKLRTKFFPADARGLIHFDAPGTSHGTINLVARMQRSVIRGVRALYSRITLCVIRATNSTRLKLTLLG